MVYGTVEEGRQWGQCSDTTCWDAGWLPAEPWAENEFALPLSNAPCPNVTHDTLYFHTNATTHCAYSSHTGTNIYGLQYATQKNMDQQDLSSRAPTHLRRDIGLTKTYFRQLGT